MKGPERGRRAPDSFLFPERLVQGERLLAKGETLRIVALAFQGDGEVAQDAGFEGPVPAGAAELERTGVGGDSTRIVGALAAGGGRVVERLHENGAVAGRLGVRQQRLEEGEGGGGGPVVEKLRHAVQPRARGFVGRRQEEEEKQRPGHRRPYGEKR